MSNIDIDEVAEQLEIATDRPAAEIKAEIEGLMQTHDYHMAGAIAVWKSDNQFQMNVGRKNYTARVLCVEPPHKATTSGGESMVANVHFLWDNPETGEVEFKSAPLWGQERIDELIGTFEEGTIFTFEATVNQKGNFTRVASAKERDEDGKILADLGFIVEDDDAYPDKETVEPMPIARLAEKIGDYELVRGYVGDIINTKGTANAVGFQLADLGTLIPLRVWFAGKYSRMTPAQIQNVKNDLAKGVEAICFGYVNKSGNNTSMNTAAIWFVE